MTSPSQRLRALLDEQDALSLEARVAGAEAEGARHLRLAAGKRQEDHLRRRSAANARLAEVEKEIAATRASLAVDGPADVSDRALVRWLEIVDRIDTQEVRDRILAQARSVPPVRDGEFFVHAARGVRIVTNLEGKVVTVTASNVPPKR